MSGHGGPTTTLVTRAASRFGRNTDLAWAPDSQSLVFSARHGISVVRLSDHRVRAVSARGTESDVDWAPRGGKLAYVAQSRSDRIRLIDPLTLAGRFLTGGFDDIPSAAWSADGSAIGFVGCRGPAGASRRCDLYVADAGDTRVRRLTRTGSLDDIESPTWAAHGSEIGFVGCSDPADPPSRCDLYIADAAGTRVRRLTRSDSIYPGLAWARSR